MFLRLTWEIIGIDIELAAPPLFVSIHPVRCPIPSFAFVPLPHQIPRDSSTE